MKKIFVLYFQLLYQLDIDSRHFYDGFIRLRGENDETSCNSSFYNRTFSIDNGPDKHKIGELIGKLYSEEIKYSCISIDDIRVLSIQLFDFCEKSGITFKNFNYRKVDSHIESSINQEINNVKDIIKKYKQEVNDKIFVALITISKLNSVQNDNKTCNRYEIHARFNKVLIFNI